MISIIVRVQGGCVIEVLSNSEEPMEVTLLDYDNEPDLIQEIPDSYRTLGIS